MSLILAAFLLAPVPRAAPPPPDRQPFFVCPTGSTLEATYQRGRVESVRCATRRIGGAPLCPLRMVVTAVAGPDTCQPARSTGAVTDGTSNTIAITESPPPTDPANGTTVSGGSLGTTSSAPPKPLCPVVGDILMIDAAGAADRCVRVEVRPPTQSVTPLTPMSNEPVQIRD
ncbi:hypothetical protein [Novosphingobium sp.]|uniref:hypothetical protein n=1 Tax=Novosphingobium sp. TaxID=1874826 RepID=UPI002732D4D2|nr:hypothetical protein [Novosphingobium sp.]MDP3907716.1 hypothetical protein [Novosphingobium sp.]